KRAGLVLELVDDAAGELGADALRAGDLGGVAGSAGSLQLAGGECGENRQGDLAADALYRGQQAEPVTLRRVGKAEQAHVVLADLEMGEDGYLVPRDAECGQGLARAMDEIAHAADV